MVLKLLGAHTVPLIYDHHASFWSKNCPKSCIRLAKGGYLCTPGSPTRSATGYIYIYVTPIIQYSHTPVGIHALRTMSIDDTSSCKLFIHHFQYGCACTLAHAVSHVYKAFLSCIPYTNYRPTHDSGHMASGYHVT